jgi:hypothetical protein
LGQKTKANSLAVTLASDQDALPITDNGGSLTVDGTFWQATQPVSGTVTANAGTNLNTSALALDSTVAKDATLTGGTQKAIMRGGQKGTTNTNADITHTASGSNHEILDVGIYDGSGNLKDPTAIRALTSSDVVSAAQSGTWTVQPGNTANTTAWKVDGSAVTQPVNNSQVGGNSISTGNGVSGTGVQRVTIASDSTGQVTLAAGSQTIGALTANQSVNNAQIAGNAISAGNGTSGTGTQRVTIASDSTGQVNAVPPTLTKGTQGSTGFSVQNLTDAGRTFLGFTASNATAGTSGTEAMASFSQNKGNTVTTSVTSYTVTSGKRLRLTCLQLAITAQAATVTRLLASIRCNTGGATITTSNIVAGFDIGGPAVSGQTAYETIPLNETFEFLGDGTLTIGVSFNPTWTTTAAKVSVTLIGYEY